MSDAQDDFVFVDKSNTTHLLADYDKEYPVVFTVCGQQIEAKSGEYVSCSLSTQLCEYCKKQNLVHLDCDAPTLHRSDYKQFKLDQSTDELDLFVLSQYNLLMRNLPLEVATLIEARVYMERSFGRGGRCAVCGLKDNPRCATQC